MENGTIKENWLRIKLIIPVSEGLKRIYLVKNFRLLKKHVNENVIIMGDFNSFTKDDSSNGTVYNPKDLIKLEEKGYIDLWKFNSKEESDRYTWYHPTGTGFK